VRPVCAKGLRCASSGVDELVRSMYRSVQNWQASSANATEVLQRFSSDDMAFMHDLAFKYAPPSMKTFQNTWFSIIVEKSDSHVSTETAFLLIFLAAVVVSYVL
jgi:hypothetical protein